MKEEKRSYTTAISLYENETLRDEIDKEYAVGKTFAELSEKYNCSENTMIVLIGMLNYPIYPWAKKIVDKNFEKLEQKKIKRVKLQ